MSRLPLHLLQHPESVAIARLDPGVEPSWDISGPFSSVTRTSHETSVICDASRVPTDVRSAGPYVPFEVAGPLDFELVGVMADLLEPLVRERISILALSSYDTDWVLVPQERTDDAAAAWRKHGFVVTPSSLDLWSPTTEDS